MAITLGPFELIEPLGSGGMGTVWRGVHRQQSVPVAIKALSATMAHDAEFREEFAREVQAVAGLSHPGIVSVYDYGTIPEQVAEACDGALVAGSPMLAMELADLGSLTNLNLIPDWPALRDLLLQLLDALGYAHARGVIHRDVKPTNILLSSTPHGWVRYKLTDFGIAHALDPYSSPNTQEQGIYRGSPDYSPPEQLEGTWRDFGPWTDLYALGCVAYEFAAGRPPFVEQNFVKLAMRHLDEPPPALAPRFGVPEGFEAWLGKLLEKDPARRFRRAADAAWSLIRLAPDQRAELTPVGEAHADGGQPTGAGASSDSIDLTPTEPVRDVTARQRRQAESTDFEQMITAEYTAGEQRAQDDDADAGAAHVQAANAALPQVAWRQVDRPPKTDQLAEADQVSKPPIPQTWRREAPTSNSAHLIGAGLNLFGLREVEFVGRQSERDAIWGSLLEVADQQAPRGVIIRGASGTGKSRLAQWTCERAHEVGAATVVSAAHNPQSEPARGLRQMLEQALRTWGQGPAAVHQRVCQTVETLFELDASQEEAYLLDYTARGVTEYLRPGAQTVDGPSVDFESRREQFAVLSRFLEALAQRRPLLVWLDDIPWGSDALGLAEFVLRGGLDVPILFVMTARDECLGRRPAAAARLEALAGRDEVVDLELGPLAAPNHIELIEHLLTLDPQLAWQVEQRTDGNPLFAIQLIRDWVDRDLLEPSDEGFALRDGARVPLPDDLFELCARRIDRFLSQHFPERADEVRQALEVAAALGRHIDRTEWVTACKNLGLALPEDLVPELITYGLARREQSGWAFIHGALTEVIERGARQADRWAYHQHNCIIMLDELYGLETPGIWRRWGTHLVRAGELEEALEPFLAAANAARQADDCPTGLEILDRIDSICHELGLDADVRQVRAWLQRAYLLRSYRHAHDPQRARQLIERAMQAARARGWLRETGLALLEEARTFAHEGRFEQALGSFESAHSIFEENGLGEEAVTTLLSMSVAHRRRGQYHQMFQTLRRASRACPAGDVRHRAMIHERHTQYYLDGPQKDLEQAAVHAERFLEVAAEKLSPVNQARAWCNLGEIHRLRGQHDLALDAYRRAYALGSGVGAIKLPCLALHNIGMVEFERGDFERARSWFRDSRVCMEKNDYRRWMAIPIMGMAACDAAAGRWESARSLFDAASERIADRPDYVRDLAVVSQSLGDSAADAGHPGLARQALEIACAQWKVIEPDRLASSQQLLESL
jgi:eukaryotic-like serine/threonine-protein kinase